MVTRISMNSGGASIQEKLRLRCGNILCCCWLWCLAGHPSPAWAATAGSSVHTDGGGIPCSASVASRRKPRHARPFPCLAPSDRRLQLARGRQRPPTALVPCMRSSPPPSPVLVVTFPVYQTWTGFGIDRDSEVHNFRDSKLRV
jgi:hypothetical protein